MSAPMPKRRSRTLHYDPSGKTVVLFMTYSPVEALWHNSPFSLPFLPISFDRVPRWNDLVVVGVHTYRVTSVSYDEVKGERTALVNSEWQSSSISPEEELKRLEDGVLCLDCRINALADGMFMVNDELWDSVVPEGARVLLCLSCFEKRLRRPINVNDLTDAPINAALRRTLANG